MVRIKNLPTPTVEAIKFGKKKIFPVGGTSAYPVDKQQPRTGRTKLILAVIAFNFFFPFIVSFLSFQLNVSFPFIASFLSFRLFLSMRYFCPFVPCLMFRSLLLPIRFNPSCRFNSSFPFIASFLSCHHFPTLRYFRPLVSSLISRSSLPFAPSFLLI